MKRFSLLICIATAIVATSCSVLQAVSLKDCKYSYKEISNIEFMNIDKSKLLSLSGIAAATKALTGKTETVPLSMVVHMNVENPNKTTASLERLYYKVSLDSVEIANGQTHEAFSVAAGEKADLPLKFTVDLKTALQGDQRAVLNKAVKNLIGISHDTVNVCVQIRPSFRLGSGVITSPRYIPINFPYTGK